MLIVIKGYIRHRLVFLCSPFINVVKSVFLALAMEFSIASAGSTADPPNQFRAPFVLEVVSDRLPHGDIDGQQQHQDHHY